MHHVNLSISLKNLNKSGKVSLCKSLSYSLCLQILEITFLLLVWRPIYLNRVLLWIMQYIKTQVFYTINLKGLSQLSEERRCILKMSECLLNTVSCL